jgi:hypothetical protein
MNIPHIGLIVTGATAAAEFQIFVKTLELWHPDATLYVFTDSATDLSKITFKGKLNVKKALDAYKGLSRKTMEAMPGKQYDSLFKEYTYEKAAVLEWMFESQPDLKTTGAWFCDADISMCAPLPTVPDSATVALSPHYIREVDCRLYGKYNAGFFWIKDPALIQVWRDAGKTSRFFEQAALETVAEAAGSALYEFPIVVNYGWWRMYQAPAAPPKIQEKFSFNRTAQGIGLLYEGVPVQSIHTHWHETTSVTGAFNAWCMSYTSKFTSHKPLAAFRRSINHK